MSGTFRSLSHSLPYRRSRPRPQNFKHHHRMKIIEMAHTDRASDLKMAMENIRAYFIYLWPSCSFYLNVFFPFSLHLSNTPSALLFGLSSVHTLPQKCVCLILRNASYGNDYECFKVRVLHRGIFKNISMRKKNRVFHLTEAPIHFRQTHNFDEVISSVAVRGYVFH